MAINRPTNRLRAIREAAGMTRNQLAELVSSTYGGRRIAGKGVSERTVVRWEDGTTPIPEKYWARLAEIFRVSASYLLGLDEIDEQNGNGNGSETVA